MPVGCHEPGGRRKAYKIYKEKNEDILLTFLMKSNSNIKQSSTSVLNYLHFLTLPNVYILWKEETYNVK